MVLCIVSFESDLIELVVHGKFFGVDDLVGDAVVLLGNPLAGKDVELVEGHAREVGSSAGSDEDFVAILSSGCRVGAHTLEFTVAQAVEVVDG